MTGVANSFRARVLGVVALSAVLMPPSWAQLFADFRTSLGSFSVELFHEDAPRTVANFVSLADGTRAWLDPRTQQVREGVPFYDGVIFHRVIPNFVIQGGSPQGTGTDGPGYKFPDELTKFPNGELRRTHAAAGRLSMANSGVHTNGSQFFITTSVTPPAAFPTHLDNKHTVFGQVVAGPEGTAAQGQAVVDAIAATPRGPSDRPLTPVVMESVRIRRVGEAAQAFDERGWALPDVTGATAILSVGYERGAAPPGSSQLRLTYERRRHAASVFNYSAGGTDWELLTVAGGAATPIAAEAGVDPLNISGVGGFPELFVRARSLNYEALVAVTLPPLSEAARLRLVFAAPAGLEAVEVRRGGAVSGSWVVSGVEGEVSPLRYGAGSGDAGLFSPVLSMGFPLSRLPWVNGSLLASLNVTLTFDAGGVAGGYFSATGVTVPVPPATSGSPVAASGVFSVLAP